MLCTLDPSLVYLGYMNLANKSLHSMGVKYVEKYLGYKSNRHIVFTKENRPASVHVQNMMSDGFFTIDVNGKMNMIESIKKNIQLFIDYGTPNLIKVYQCTDPDDYEMAQVGGISNGVHDSSLKRLVLKFNSGKMKLLDVMEDSVLWSEFRSLSQARAFNLESKHYTH